MGITADTPACRADNLMIVSGKPRIAMINSQDAAGPAVGAS
jgi:hypothetical protein